MRRMYSKPQLLEAVEQEAEVNGLKAFENIVDKDGHKRFIEQDITVNTISGVTIPYAKWSLSGSHLLIVICLEVANGTSIANDTRVCEIEFPEYIRDKILPFAENFIDYKVLSFWSSSLGTQNMNVLFKKATTTKFAIDLYTAVTFTADRGARIAFDLLIDNE